MISLCNRGISGVLGNNFRRPSKNCSWVTSGTCSPSARSARFTSSSDLFCRNSSVTSGIRDTQSGCRDSTEAVDEARIALSLTANDPVYPRRTRNEIPHPESSIGRGAETRTRNLTLPKRALYQLSHTPITIPILSKSATIIPWNEDWRIF